LTFEEGDNSRSMLGSFDMLIFDLDGTISDPIVGITRSINHALVSFGYEEVSMLECERFIGPPIDEIFVQASGTDSPQRIAELVKTFRERYSTTGYAENTLYPGVSDVLHALHDSGVDMAVCTTKRADFATKILRRFNLLHLFSFVEGGDIGISKTQQLVKLISKRVVTTSSIMIGDRGSDIIAAHFNGISAAGVLWGYGSREELEQKKPSVLFNEPSELSVFGGL